MFDSNNPEVHGIVVVKRPYETEESLIKRFKRKVTKSEILREYKKKMEYIKPSIAKKRKSIEARKRDEKDSEKAKKKYDKMKKNQKRGDKKSENTTSSEG